MPPTSGVGDQLAGGRPAQVGVGGRRSTSRSRSAAARAAAGRPCRSRTCRTGPGGRGASGRRRASGRREAEEEVLAVGLAPCAARVPSSSAAPAANRPCGLVTPTGRRRSVAGGAARRWIVWPSGTASLRLRRRRARRRLLGRRPPVSGGRSPVVLVRGEHVDAAGVPLRRPRTAWPGRSRRTSVASSAVCIRAPTATTLASLCSRPSVRGLLAPGQRRADALHLVRGDLLAVAGAADHDAEAARVGDGRSAAARRQNGG